MIRASGEHLLALFNNVIEVSALASGRMKLHLEPVEVRELLEEVAALLEGQRHGRPVQIMVHADEALPSIHADATRLRQIVLNLGTNALKFTESGEVVLGAERRQLLSGELGVAITVRDSGSGIAKEDLPRLFEEFTELSTRDKNRPGSGLGLSIVQKLTHLHGGTVEVQSKVGVGSKFTVVLPLRARPPEEGL
jgi:signal transduction histidine kinase